VVIESAFSGVILFIQPAWANQRQQDATAGNAFIDGLAEVTADFDGRHIHEHGLDAELLDQIVEQSASLSFGIVATIANKDGAQFQAPVFQCYFTSVPSLGVVFRDYTKRIA